jgi:hypothetical protein
VPDHNCYFFLGESLPLAFPHSASDGIFAYVGLGATELLPYLLALAAWAGAAFIAILQWPLFFLLRRLRGKPRNLLSEDVKPSESSAPPATETLQEVNPADSGP